jgi:hypothetical protein
MPYLCYNIKICIHEVDGLGNKNGKNYKCIRFKVIYKIGVKKIQDFKIFIKK